MNDEFNTVEKHTNTVFCLVTIFSVILLVVCIAMAIRYVTNEKTARITNIHEKVILEKMDQYCEIVDNLDNNNYSTEKDAKEKGIEIYSYYYDHKDSISVKIFNIVRGSMDNVDFEAQKRTPRVLRPLNFLL